MCRSRKFRIKTSSIIALRAIGVNRYAFQAGIPALTHGPAATGAHTAAEQVPVAELLRVARVYALTALAYCTGP